MTTVADEIESKQSLRLQIRRVIIYKGQFKYLIAEDMAKLCGLFLSAETPMILYDMVHANKKLLF